MFSISTARWGICFLVNLGAPLLHGPGSWLRSPTRIAITKSILQRGNTCRGMLQACPGAVIDLIKLIKTPIQGSEVYVFLFLYTVHPLRFKVSMWLADMARIFHQDTGNFISRKPYIYKNSKSSRNSIFYMKYPHG